MIKLILIILLGLYLFLNLVLFSILTFMLIKGDISKEKETDVDPWIVTFAMLPFGCLLLLLNFSIKVYDNTWKEE